MLSSFFFFHSRHQRAEPLTNNPTNGPRGVPGHSRLRPKTDTETKTAGTPTPGPEEVLLVSWFRLFLLLSQVVRVSALDDLRRTPWVDESEALSLLSCRSRGSSPLFHLKLFRHNNRNYNEHKSYTFFMDNKVRFCPYFLNTKYKYKYKSSLSFSLFPFFSSRHPNFQRPDPRRVNVEGRPRTVTGGRVPRVDVKTDSGFLRPEVRGEPTKGFSWRTRDGVHPLRLPGTTVPFHPKHGIGVYCLSSLKMSVTFDSLNIEKL